VVWRAEEGARAHGLGVEAYVGGGKVGGSYPSRGVLGRHLPASTAGRRCEHLCRVRGRESDYCTRPQFAAAAVHTAAQRP